MISVATRVITAVLFATDHVTSAPIPAIAPQNAVPAKSSTAPMLDATGRDNSNDVAVAVRVGSTAVTRQETVTTFPTRNHCACVGVTLASRLVSADLVGVYVHDLISCCVADHCAVALLCTVAALILPLASMLSLLVPAVAKSILSDADVHIPVFASFLNE